jgi:hypothetical protein
MHTLSTRGKNILDGLLNREGKVLPCVVWGNEGRAMARLARVLPGESWGK